MAGIRIVTVHRMGFGPDGNPLNPWDNHGGTPAFGSVTGHEMLKSEGNPDNVGRTIIGVSYGRMGCSC
jgi:hypothetical protein